MLFCAAVDESASVFKKEIMLQLLKHLCISVLKPAYRKELNRPRSHVGLCNALLPYLEVCALAPLLPSANYG